MNYSDYHTSSMVLKSSIKKKLMISKPSKEKLKI